MTNNLSILGKLKTGLQNLGRSLSDMVMPNIGAFIAWGLLTALFIATGWLPNEKLSSMVSPMLTYVLPVLIAGILTVTGLGYIIPLISAVPTGLTVNARKVPKCLSFR